MKLRIHMEGMSVPVCIEYDSLTALLLSDMYLLRSCFTKRETIKAKTDVPTNAPIIIIPPVYPLFFTSRDPLRV